MLEVSEMEDRSAILSGWRGGPSPLPHEDASKLVSLHITRAFNRWMETRSVDTNNAVTDYIDALKKLAAAQAACTQADEEKALSEIRKSETAEGIRHATACAYFRLEKDPVQQIRQGLRMFIDGFDACEDNIAVVDAIWEVDQAMTRDIDDETKKRAIETLDEHFGFGQEEE